MEQPDLTGAHTYAEGAGPNTVDRWHVLADGTTVVYERRPGEFEPSIIAAHTLTNSIAWVEVSRRDHDR
jgi:hypothetical protein